MQKIQFDKLINLIYMTVFVTTIGISSCAPIFPFEAKERHISQSYVGLIFAVNPLTSLAVALTVGKRLEFRRKKLIILGIVVSAVGFIGFGLVKRIPQPDTQNFILFSLLSR